MISDKRLYLAADGETVVEDGDARANTLLVGAGSEIADDDARRYGLLPKAADPVPAARDVPDWSGEAENLAQDAEKKAEGEADGETVVEDGDPKPEAEGKAIHHPPATKARIGPSRGRGR